MKMRKTQKRFLGVLLAGAMAVGSVPAIPHNVLLVQAAETATEQLSKPTNVHWDGMTATWNSVPNATGYEVALVGLEDEEEVAKQVVTSASCNFFQDVAAKGSGYRVRVRALDNTKKYADSDPVYGMPVMMLWLNTAGGNLMNDNDGVGVALYITVPIGLQINVDGSGPLLEGKKEGNIAHYYHNGKELFSVDEETFDYKVSEGVTSADNLVYILDDAKENESPGLGIGFYDASQLQPGKTPEVPAQPTPVVSDNPSVPTPVVSGNPSTPVSSEPVKSSVPTESVAPAGSMTPSASATPTTSAAPASSTASGSNTTPVQSTAPAASATPAANTQNEASNGTTTSSDTVKPKGTSLSSVKAGKKKMTVKWKKQGNQTTGYQVQYALNSKFTSAKTKTVSKNSTTSVTISKLAAKKKYYVRIRTYKTTNVNGTSTKLYSGWSKAKTVKVK